MVTNTFGKFASNNIHMKELIKSIRSLSEEQKLILARDASTPVEVLYKLSKDHSERVRSCVLLNPSVSLEILLSRLRDQRVGVRAIIAAHSKTPTEILECLSEDNSLEVLSAVGRNELTPKEILVKLSKSEKFGVRSSVASNPNTPIEVLEFLSQADEWYTLKANIAKNPSTPHNILTSLLSSSEPHVRMGVARNDNAPTALLEILCRDEDLEVRLFAKCHPKLNKNNFVEIQGTNHIWRKVNLNPPVYVCGCFIGGRGELLKEIGKYDKLYCERIEILHELDTKFKEKFK